MSYYRFPEEHWPAHQDHNPLERVLREIRRRTRVVGRGTLAAHRRDRLVDQEILERLVAEGPGR